LKVIPHKDSKEVIQRTGRKKNVYVEINYLIAFKKKWSALIIRKTSFEKEKKNWFHTHRKKNWFHTHRKKFEIIGFTHRKKFEIIGFTHTSQANHIIAFSWC